jgi:hypothetical protein
MKDTEALVMRYLRAWQEGDGRALRACLADEIDFDWGIATYTDPDEFVAQSTRGITWSDVRVLAAQYSEGHAAVLYEGVNQTDGVRVRAAELLTVTGDVIRRATVVFTALGEV